jgi:hypothetical protein
MLKTMNDLFLEVLVILVSSWFHWDLVYYIKVFSVCNDIGTWSKRLDALNFKG